MPDLSLSSSVKRSLRVQVTDRCNLRCLYCMPEGDHAFGRLRGALDSEGLTELCAWLCREAAVTRVKLTGGEPLLRRDIGDIVAQLSRLSRVQEVSLTTNAALLERWAASLAEAGLSRVNISLDTLDPLRFSQLTRGGHLQSCLRGIDAALAAGLRPVKLNAVLRRSHWRHDVPALLSFASARGLELRFIELMHTGTDTLWTQEQYLPASVVQGFIAREADLKPLPTPVSAPARRFLLHWRGRDLALGFITPRSKPFCLSCNRLRLDARGGLRRCLVDAVALPLGRLLDEQGEPAARIALRAYLDGKRAPEAMSMASSMAAIGG